jgi:dienelactone hydrolase
MRDWARLLGVLSRAKALHAAPDPRCARQENLIAGNGWRFDRYSPRKPLGGTLVLLHGWTLAGKDDPRLVAFAQSLAIAGIACVVPLLPGLADLALDPADVEGLGLFLREEGKASGVVGFSLGGSYALLAAQAASPRFVTAISGYGDLPGLYAHWFSWGKQRPASPTARESWLYMKLVLAWRQRRKLALPEADQRELENHLRGFCEGGDRESVWAFHDRVLSPHDLEALDQLAQDPSVLRALSLVDHPPVLACPVVILHDQHDAAVPASQAELAAQAVRAGSPGIAVEVLVTELLQHVSPKIALKPWEIARLLNLLSPLVR